MSTVQLKDVKNNIKLLMETINDKNTSKENKLKYLKLLNILIDFHINLIKTLKAKTPKS